MNLKPSSKYRLKLALTGAITLLLSSGVMADKTKLQLNEQDYFETQGLNVLVFSNWYDGLFSDSKISGIELIQHGERNATNGDLRLNATPEQWDEIPQFIERKIYPEQQAIEAFMRYPAYDLNYSIKVQAQGEGVHISVILPKALPKALEGIAGFNLEFVPSAYFHKAFLMDETAGIFPVYPGGQKEINGTAAAHALAQGQQLVLAPEDSSNRVTIRSNGSPLALYDARAKAQNGWFVVRSLIPAGKTGAVIEWDLKASTAKNWLRQPMIAHSQVGYHPAQRKVAVIEMDKLDKKIHTAKLIKIQADGSSKTVLSAKPNTWGQYLRYIYREFDFTQVKEPGLYAIQYGDQQTASFRIDTKVYEAAWHPTLDTYMPVQMDHMLVNEAYRVWHGASHLDDALQAPINHEHFDLYGQGPTTDTPYKPGEHIPGLNIGGWYDAGDFDIRTQSQYATVMDLVAVWENFGLKRDVTSVNYPEKLVDLHVADGKPDVLQQIEHGTLALIAQHRALGRAIPGIVEAHIEQYTHLGDGITKTDNQVYDPKMGKLEENGKKSGKFDDRWAFTSKSTPLNYGSIAGLAAASRALKGYNDELAREALMRAQKAWADEQAKTEPDMFQVGNTAGGGLEEEQLKAATELLLTTGESQYAEVISTLLPKLADKFQFHAVWFLRAQPKMPKAFRDQLEPLVVAYQKQQAELSKQNPFGVLITNGGWAGSGTVIRIAITNYYMYKAYPKLFDKEQVLSALNFLYGTHPDHNLSLVSNVGTRSKEVAYGMNRADFSFIAGGIVPGILILKPDFPENREDWPFFWGENEYVITQAAEYIFLVNAAEELLGEK